ncbi:MAG TPA: NAD(P)/FAD-dependent oxidoreductase, partial [Chloroflexota bacterium]|nr:NAD(P)/FAD-dependent oxidoreductase [Chloroflexota bacterium]
GWRSRFAFTLPRLQLDAALLRYARSRGVEVMEKHRCTGVRMESSGAVLEMDRLNSGAVRFRSKVLVGADGLSSVVCRLLGIDACSRWPRRLGLIAHYDQVEGIDECGEMHVGPGTYCGLAPLPEGRVNVGLVMPLPAGGDGLRLESRFEAAIRTMPEVAAKLDRGRRIKRIRGMGPMSRRVASTAGLGYLLVGDAAGFLDPFTGEGIYRALRGAELAAETIDHALQRIRAEAAPNLAEYARAREREFAGKERVTWLVQAGLAFPPLLETLCTRSRGSTVVAQTVGNVLGDVGQSSTLLKPWIAARLLLPA